MPAIFISHSAKDPYAERIRDGVADGLNKGGFRVLLDSQRIDPGDAWRGKLHQWLQMCHGAVILFSREALASDWVLKEATILTWRYSLNPNLKIVPALLGDVQPAETGLDRFGPLELGEIQFARVDSSEESDANAEKLIARIVRQFEGFADSRHDEATRIWLRDVKIWLGKAAREHLTAAARALEISEQDWGNSKEELALMLASQLLCCDLSESLQALREVAKSMPPDDLKRLVNNIVPSWVSLAAARRILPACKLPEKDRFVAINGDFPETARDYIRRATCCATGLVIVSPTDVVGEETQRELLARFDRALLRAFNVREDQRLVELICKKAKEPLFMIVDSETMHKETLEALRRRYSKVTFIILSGQSFPDPADLGLDRFERIVPALEEEDELTAEMERGEAGNLLIA